MMAGTGLRSAASGSQSRAARRQPSGIGIHTGSTSRSANGSSSTIFNAWAPCACFGSDDDVALSMAASSGRDAAVPPPALRLDDLHQLRLPRGKLAEIHDVEPEQAALARCR